VTFRFIALYKYFYLLTYLNIKGGLTIRSENVLSALNRRQCHLFDSSARWLGLAVTETSFQPALISTSDSRVV